ncbi:MAG: urate hydroxylase PuuD [Saprospiraceae bacterium]|nr:urate hydroxylase PuuD [Saprospiraceae bacterium]
MLVILSIIANTYFAVKGSPWEAHLLEWLNIVIRVMHITFGIAWIGASFYFVFLENALNRTENIREELAGNLWAVHGGGFYYLEKYKVAPKTIPKHLHWFKYEAYFTWLSGFCLLFVVYYFNASAFLIDKTVLDITGTQGILIGVGSFILGWMIYDLMCKSPLIKKQVWFVLLGFALLVGFAYFYNQVFSARAAYIHFGAMIGGLMVANVFFVIIPAQKAMVKAAKEGLPLDPQLGKNALSRSIHNNYFTLPVLFVMVSNHFPSTFGYKYQWLILALITLGAAGVKHYLNLREKNEKSVWVMPISALILLSASFISAPAKNPEECKSEISFIEVNNIIQKRCISCHSAQPTDEINKVAPNGVKYDTPDQIVVKKNLILQRVVITKTMPQNNITGMTPEERDVIRCWIEQGASLN